jgi:hypothetical protein
MILTSAWLSIVAVRAKVLSNSQTFQLPAARACVVDYSRCIANVVQDQIVHPSLFYDITGQSHWSSYCSSAAARREIYITSDSHTVPTYQSRSSPTSLPRTGRCLSLGFDGLLLTEKLPHLQQTPRVAAHLCTKTTEKRTETSANGPRVALRSFIHTACRHLQSPGFLAGSGTATASAAVPGRCSVSALA